MTRLNSKVSQSYQHTFNIKWQQQRAMPRMPATLLKRKKEKLWTTKTLNTRKSSEARTRVKGSSVGWCLQSFDVRKKTGEKIKLNNSKYNNDNNNNSLLLCGDMEFFCNTHHCWTYYGMFGVSGINPFSKTTNTFTIFHYYMKSSSSSLKHHHSFSFITRLPPRLVPFCRPTFYFLKDALLAASLP